MLKSELEILIPMVRIIIYNLNAYHVYWSMRILHAVYMQGHVREYSHNIIAAGTHEHLVVLPCKAWCT